MGTGLFPLPGLLDRRQMFAILTSSNLAYSDQSRNIFHDPLGRTGEVLDSPLGLGMRWYGLRKSALTRLLHEFRSSLKCERAEGVGCVGDSTYGDDSTPQQEMTLMKRRHPHEYQPQKCLSCSYLALVICHTGGTTFRSCIPSSQTCFSHPGCCLSCLKLQVEI